MYRLFVRRNEKSVCFYGCALISLWALALVLRHWCIGPEHPYNIEGEPTIQHSRYSSRGFPKHKKQLQRDFVG